MRRLLEHLIQDSPRSAAGDHANPTIYLSLAEPSAETHVRCCGAPIHLAIVRFELFGSRRYSGEFAMQRRRPLANFRLDRGFVDGEHPASFGHDMAGYHSHRYGTSIRAIDKLPANV